MKLTWQQRKEFRLASLRLRLEFLRHRPLWEFAPQFALIMHEMQAVAQQSQFYDAAAKARCLEANQ
jgi:hypothetical protein